MFQDIFALRDDPFRVVGDFEAVDPNLLANLHRLPLLIHKDSELKALFCATAGPFAQHISRFEKHLSRSGYSENPPKVGHAHNIAVIAGGQGTGKTTLASYLVHTLQKIVEGAGGGWMLRDDLKMGRTEDAEDFKARIDDLKKDIEANSGKSDHCCVLVDDVQERALEHVLSLSTSFATTRFMWLFITTNDLELIKRDFKRTRYSVQMYPTSGLEPDQAVAFVASRVKRFRDPSLEILQDAFRLHPYDEENVKTAVEKLGGKNGGRAPITLRLFAGTLSDHLQARADYIEEKHPGFKIGDSAPEELIQYRIDLTDVDAII